MRNRLIGCGSLILASATCLGNSWDEKRLIVIARESAVAVVTHASPPELSEHDPSTPVFVTIEVGGVVRGCRGGLIAQTGTLEEEVARAARDAAAHDPRYRPLAKSALSANQ